MNNNFLIGTINDGLRKDLKPWATPEDSFDSLTNAYQWRGRIVRRQGYTLLGQLCTQHSGIVGGGVMNFATNLFGALGIVEVFFVPGSLVLTINGGANYTFGEDPDNPGQIIQTSGAGLDFLNGFIRYTTSEVFLFFSAPPGGLAVATFCTTTLLPVMGLRTRELFAINAQDLIAFDTQFAYRFSNTNSMFQLLASVMPVTWNGADWQFFWTTNYAGAFWATNSVPGLNGWNVQNFAGSAGVGNLATVNVTSAGNNVQVGDFVHFINLDPTLSNNSGVLAVVTVAGNPFTVRATNLPSTSTFTWTNGATITGMVLDSMQTITGQDGIRYYADTASGTTWVNYNPPIDVNNALAGALLIFPYRGYLVFLNTTEGNDQGTFNFGNRARWTEIGTPYYSFPDPITPNPQGVDINAARDDLFGRGGANDAPTQEVIVSAGFIRDILIVNFERSTWRLRFVNNAQNPFVWERINVELGSSSTFSAIPFDKGLMTIGERGITISDVNDTVRFDEKIPDQIFQIRIANEGFQRVYGIRTFRTRLNYWTYPSGNVNNIFPDKVLVYNYDTKNWAFFDDVFTCFGYHYPFSDKTWADLTEDWSNYDSDSYTWDAAELEEGFESIVAGNQQGFVFLLEQTNAANSKSLYITAVTNAAASVFTSPNNNLPDGTWIELTGLVGTVDEFGVSLNGRRFKVVNPSNDPNNFTLQEFTLVDGGTATGGTYTFTLSSAFTPVFPGSVFIVVGGLTFQDVALDGILTVTNVVSLSTGIIDYNTGIINLFFVPVIGPTQVEIRVVSQNIFQGFQNTTTSGTYEGGGYVIKLSNIDITSKIFNFLKDDKRTRISRIDFYVDSTNDGEFSVDILGDSSNVPVNTPLADNPRSNVVLTQQNPYQVGSGENETIYRLYCDAISQTFQCRIFLSDAQMSVKRIQESDIEVLAMNFLVRRRARLV